MKLIENLDSKLTSSNNNEEYSLVNFDKLNVIGYLIKHSAFSIGIVIFSFLLESIKSGNGKVIDAVNLTYMLIALAYFLYSVVGIFIPPLIYVYKLEGNDDYFFIEYQCNFIVKKMKFKRAVTSFEIVPSGRSNPYLKIESFNDKEKISIRQYSISKWNLKLMKKVEDSLKK